MALVLNGTMRITRDSPLALVEWEVEDRATGALNLTCLNLTDSEELHHLLQLAWERGVLFRRRDDALGGIEFVPLWANFFKDPEGSERLLTAELLALLLSD
jgi:hypothetical protein